MSPLRERVRWTYDRLVFVLAKEVTLLIVVEASRVGIFACGGGSKWAFAGTRAFAFAVAGGALAFAFAFAGGDSGGAVGDAFGFDFAGCVDACGGAFASFRSGALANAFGFACAFGLGVANALSFHCARTRGGIFGIGLDTVEAVGLEAARLFSLTR